MIAQCSKKRKNSFISIIIFLFIVTFFKFVSNTTTYIQLFPKGKVNGGGYIPKCKASRYITDLEGDSCFSIYQISWIKIRKVSFL